MPRLLDAIVGVARSFSLPEVLRRIVEASRELVSARYGAFGVVAPDGTLSDFVEVGVDDADRARIGSPPTGKGVLGVLINDPRPLRLSDLTAHPESAGFPANHPPMRTFLGVPVLVGERVYGILLLAEKRDGTEFTEQDEKILGMLAGTAGVAIEHVTLFEQVRQRERWLSASYDVTSALLAGEEPSSTLRLVANRATVVAGATAGGIALPREPDRDVLVFEIVEPPGEDADRLTGLSVPVENTATGVAFATREPVVVSNYGGHVTIQQRDRPRLPEVIAGLDSAVAVPLVAGDETLGVLVVARFRDNAPFTETEVELARSFAVHAALAVKFARAEQDRRRLAVFEDRDRIARDLHDLVIQRLFATGLGLESMSRLIANDQVAQRIVGFAQDLDRTIRDIRNSIFSLQEPDESRDSLRSELLRLALGSAEMLGFEPKLGFDGPLDAAVPDPVRSDVLGTLREALSNVARHAHATRVSIDVDVDRGGRRLTLVVEDDGVGVPARPRRRSGLANMEERAARWRGACSVRPGPNGGTLLTWTVALPGGSERP